MIPLDAVKYLIFSAIMVVSIFVGIRLIFAHDMRRDEWRSKIKRRIYMSQRRFKRVTILLGILLITLGTWVALQQALGLMAD